VGGRRPRGKGREGKTTCNVRFSVRFTITVGIDLLVSYKRKGESRRKKQRGEGWGGCPPGFLPKGLEEVEKEARRLGQDPPRDLSRGVVRKKRN